MRIHFNHGRYALLSLLAAMTAITGATEEPFTRILDTGVPSSAPLTSVVLELETDWVVVSESDTEYEFKGDAVLRNDKIAAVVRKQGDGVELYSRHSPQATLEAVLCPAGSDSSRDIQRIVIRENAAELAKVDIVFGGGDIVEGLSIELGMGRPFIQTHPLAKTEYVLLEAPCEAVVLPDFFADDMVIHAVDFPVAYADLPSEHFLVHMADRGNAMVMAVWDDSNQDVRVRFGSHNERRTIDQTRIAYGESGSVWVAVLATPDIWRSHNVRKPDRGQILPMGWKTPFPAVWRVDWRRSNGLTDSWEMAIENEDGSFRKSNLFEASRDDWTDQDWWSTDRPRRRWNTGLGGFWYPCWLDRQGYAYLQPLEEHITFEGPAIAYPINRSADTPIDVFTVTDIVRATLGVGPCQYILDVEGQGLAFKGRPTCDVRDTLNPIYANGQQVNRRLEVERALDNVETFIQLIRGRIEKYAVFGREMEAYLKQQQLEASAPKPFLEEMIDLTKRINESVEARREGIKTPAYARELVDDFRSDLVGYQGDDAAQRCKELTAAFVDIGNNQDELVAECRLAVKLLRQRAALAMANDPETSEVVNEIRKRSQSILREPVNYEAAHH